MLITYANEHEIIIRVDAIHNNICDEKCTCSKPPSEV